MSRRMYTFHCPCPCGQVLLLSLGTPGRVLRCPETGVAVVVRSTKEFDEGAWLECTRPEVLLDYLGLKASARKQRLFAVACCRSVWPWLTDGRSRRAVEVCERYAEAEAGPEELRAARAEAGRAILDAGEKHPRDEGPCRAAEAAYAAAALDPWAASWVSRWAAFSPQEQARQADLAREVFGNPFRPAALDPAWLSANGGAVAAIAREVYAERAFDQAPVLADALEDAGCADGQLLDHLRGRGEHVRGCWALDLLLGKR